MVLVWFSLAKIDLDVHFLSKIRLLANFQLRKSIKQRPQHLFYTLLCKYSIMVYIFRLVIVMYFFFFLQ